MRPVFLILIPGFAKNEADTTTIPFAQTFIKAINKNHPELEVVVITLDHPATRIAYSWFGNKVIPLNGTGAKFRPLLWLRLYMSLRKVVRKKKVLGILNFWCADNALVTQYFCRWNNIKHFTWLQGQDARKGNKALWFFKPRKDCLIALSGFLREEFRKNYSIIPSHTIYPGLDISLFNNTRHVEKDIDIIGVGSLTSLKQYHIFIEVIGVLRKHYPGIRSIIIGKGPNEPMLRQTIIDHGMGSNIELKGELAHNETLELMKRSKILLHPSSYEGYGMVCMEALAAGCHVVSFINPESGKVKHWHIAGSKDEMIAMALRILEYPEHEFDPVLWRNIDDCVNNMMQLYDHHPAKVQVVPSRTERMAE